MVVSFVSDGEDRPVKGALAMTEYDMLWMLISAPIAWARRFRKSSGSSFFRTKHVHRTLR
jgi:hypothetical protein